MKNKSLFVISPHHFDHSAATLIEGLNKLEGIKVFSNTTHNYCKNTVQTLDAQIKLAKMADYVMLCHSALEIKYQQVIGPLVDALKGNIHIFLDGSDYSDYEASPDEYQLYLKRELNKPSDFKNVVPFLFAAEDRCFARPNASAHNLWLSKSDDLVCIMSSCEKRPWRFDIISSLEENYKDEETVFVGEYREGQTLPHIDTGNRHYSGYFKKLLHSKISVDAYGCGEARQTGRFWESLANGCLLMYQPIDPYIWPNTYVDGEDFVVYNNTEELIDKSKYYIKNTDEAQKIATNGYYKLKKYHTTLQRGKEFLSHLKEYL